MVTWAYDIETYKWDKLVCAVAVSEDGETVIMKSDSETAEWYRSLPKNDVVISHNGGGFDFLQLISATPDLQWSAAMAGSAIVTCRAKGGALCQDSFRLFPISLAKWTGRKQSTGLDCECGRDCGGYCAIQLDMPAAKMTRLIDYCASDAGILLEQWLSDVAALEADGLSVRDDRTGRVRTTIGSVAWHTAAAMAGLDPSAPVDPEMYENGRRAYYGGRTEVGRTRAASGYRYDVHAMYPAMLIRPVPVGRPRGHAFDDAARVYRSGKLGLFHAIATLPQTDLPELPHRYSGKARGRLIPDRLLWTTGRIEGWYSSVELQAAERHGAKIERIDCGYTWEADEPIFAPYVEHIYAARRRAIDSGNDRWGSVLKWFANSLSGKLAQRPEVTRLVVLGELDDPLEGWHHCGGRVFASTHFRVSPCAHSWCAATLTARARVTLLDRLKRHSGRWLYCDTDSTYLMDVDNRDVHESALGTWGYEGECNDWTALAPKLYRYRDERGAPHVRARGVPRPSWETLDALASGETVRADGGVERIRSSGGSFVARTVSRTHLDAHTGRCGTRFIGASGVTRPLHRTRDGEYV